MVPLVARTFDKVVVPTTVSVLVTVDELPTKPPYKRSVEVAKAPRAVTDASVSVSANKYAGQFRPLVRQTVEPPTVKALNEPVLAFSWVVEAMPLTNRFVVVTFEPVAFVKVTAFKADVPVTESALKIPWPRTVKVEVTVEEAPTKPPYNCRVLVANEPRAVTDASVSNSTAAGQFVPVWRQTFTPPTVSEFRNSPRVELTELLYTPPLVYTLDAEPKLPATYRSLPSNANRLLMKETVADVPPIKTFAEVEKPK